MTAIQPIAAMRAAYLELCIKQPQAGSRDCGRELRRFNLPMNLGNKTNAYVPLKAALLFMQSGGGASREDFVTTLNSRLGVSDFHPRLRDSLLCATSLESALRAFCTLSDHEQSTVHYTILERDDEVRISSRFEGLESHSIDDVGEWLRIVSLLAVVRHFAGARWVPTRLSLRSPRAPDPRVLRDFDGTEFSFGQSETVVVFPASLLKLATISNAPRVDAATVENSCSAGAGPASWDFPTSLRHVIESCLDDGYPDIKLAAGFACCSKRTLQRRLKACKLSYTDIVQEARFNVAAELLQRADAKVIEIASAVGYDDPSHFARAFRRAAGVSPIQYRGLQATG